MSKKAAKPLSSSKSAASIGFLNPWWEAMRDDRWFLGVILILSFGLPWLHLHFLQRMPGFGIPVMDSLDYVRTAGDLLDPRVIPEPFYHSPLYAWFVTLVFKFSGVNLVALRLAQIILHAFTVLLMYGFGRRWFSRNVGRISALVYSLYGPILFFNTEILNVALILFLAVLGLSLVHHAWEAPSLMRWAFAGIVLGLSVLVRADALVFVLLVPSAIYIFNKSSLPSQTRLLHSIVAIAGTVLMLVGIGLRNKSVGGGFKMLPDNGKLNFYQGNNPDYKKTIGIRIASWYTLSHMPLAAGFGTEMNELGQGDFFATKAKEFIVKQPADWLGCVAYKIRALINSYELPETFDVYATAKHSPILAALTWKLGPFHFPFGLLFPLAVLGAWIARTNSKNWWLVAFVLAMLVSLVGYWNSARYRLGIMPVLILWAAVAADWLWQRAKAKETLHLSKAIGVIAVVNVATLWPIDHFSKSFNFEAERRAMAGLELFPKQPERGLQLLHEATELDPNSYFTHNNYGLALLDANRLDEAIVQFTKAVEIFPQYYIGYDNLGKAFGRSGKTVEAQRAFEKVLEIYPRSYLTHYNLGVAFMQQKKNTEAIEHFRKATEISPAYADAYNNWGTLLLEENKLDEAAIIFQRVLQIDPSHERAQKNLQLVAEMKQRQSR